METLWWCIGSVLYFGIGLGFIWSFYSKKETDEMGGFGILFIWVIWPVIFVAHIVYTIFNRIFGKKKKMKMKKKEKDTSKQVD